MNCNTLLQGNFCHICGQKVIEQKERTLKYFIIQFFGAAFFLESSFIKNLWRLVSAPGLMAQDFAEGRRKRWMAPFSLFLLINLIYFIVNPLTDFNLPLHDHLYWHDITYGPMAARMVENRIQKREITAEAYEQMFNAKTINLSKSMMVLNVPVMALFLSLVFFRDKRFFADHFIYALYLFSFFLLVSCLWIGLLNAYLWTGLPAYQFLLPIGLLLLTLYYLVFSIRRFYYVKSFFLNLLSAIGVFVAIVLTVYFYRFIMFMVTFAAT
ncbi:MAG: DUF3667 domain-containing protein [Cyclobacteriaceae bacterium]|nr:DUF3667 domain-containing protein [Cyclobacteriaceae bacterium]